MKKPKANVTRWAKWARDRKARHLCVRCGKKTGKRILCDKCNEADLARRRLKARSTLIRAVHTGTLEEAFTESVSFFDINEAAKLSEAAPIVSEICERLHELEDIRLGLAVDILTRLNRVCEISHMAFRYTVLLMHGDATIFDSFQEQAENRAMSKQAAHAEFHAVIAAIEQVFPELSHQIRHIRGQVSRAEERATPGTNTQGIVVTSERHAT